MDAREVKEPQPQEAFRQTYIELVLLSPDQQFASMLEEIPPSHPPSHPPPLPPPLPLRVKEVLWLQLCRCRVENM